MSGAGKAGCRVKGRDSAEPHDGLVEGGDD
jgi:hypothetical protein